MPCQPRRPIRDGFEFRNVGFAYPGSSHMVVENINFRLEAQEKIALIGENGAGKTTLVKLLARLYDPTAGQILLDGIDLREYESKTSGKRSASSSRITCAMRCSPKKTLGLAKSKIS